MDYRSRCGNYWYSELPKKGWEEIDVIDLDEYPGGSCSFCSTNYRYEHIIKHLDIAGEFNVGVVCAEKLTQDYVNPRRREKELKQRKSKIERWVQSSKWKKSEKGNIYREENGVHVLIFGRGANFKVKIGDIWGKKTFPSCIEAKKAAFCGLEWLNSRN